MIHFSWLKTPLLRSRKWLIMHTVNRDHDPPFLTRLQVNPNSGRKIRQISLMPKNTQRNPLHPSSDDFFQIDSQEKTRSWLVNCLYHNAVRHVSNLLWPIPAHLNEFNKNAGLEGKGCPIPTKNMGGIIFGWQAKQLKNTAQFVEKHDVSKRLRRKIWRTKESKSLGSRGRLNRKMQRPYNLRSFCYHRA